ncbi:MAG TPA: hypothetical protein VGK67_38485 [Myxococcales bacterium]|jgi:hypothetical protein
MKKFIGTLAAMAVLGLAAGAQAQSGDISGGTGGSGSMGGTTGSTGSTTGSTSGSKTGTMGEQQQLEGKVLKADRNSITIEHMGAAVSLQVQSSTAFQGVKSAKDIKEGSQVRASFNLKGAKNEATSIEVLPSSQGGSGSFGTQPGSSGSGSSGSGGSGSSGSSGSGSDTSGGY